MRLWGHTAVTTHLGLVVAIDASNYVLVKSKNGGREIEVEKVVSGTPAIILFQNDGDPKQEAGVWFLDCLVSQQNLGDTGFVHARQQFRSEAKISDADVGNIYENMSFLGFYSSQGFGVERIYSWIVTKVNK